MNQSPPAFDPEKTEGIFRAGSRLFGRYVLAGVVGEGGMGVVWRAHDEKLERDVALKLLPDRVRRDPEAVQDLKRETRRCLELTHPNIVRVYDFVDDPLAAAIAMEYVSGKSLAALKAARPSGTFDPADLLPLITQLGAALDYAHAVARVVHRDLKPANLLVTTDGMLKVADFGIARSLHETQTRQTANLHGTVGTLAYMGPQHLAGQGASPADDIYALGATLYDLLTGRPPFFRGDLIQQIQHTAPVPLAGRRDELENVGAPIPAAWEQAILACLAKRAEERPRTAGEVVAWLKGDPAGDRTELIPRFPTASRTESSPEFQSAPTRSMAVTTGRRSVHLPTNRRAIILSALGVAAAVALAAVAFRPAAANKLAPATSALKSGPIEAERTEPQEGSKQTMSSPPAPQPVRLPELGGRAKSPRVSSGLVEIAANDPKSNTPVAVPDPVRMDVIAETPATVGSPAVASTNEGQPLAGLAVETLAVKPRDVRTPDVGTLAAETGGLELRLMNADLRLADVAVRIDDKLRTPSAAGLIDEVRAAARVVEIGHPDYEPWRQSVLVRDQQNTPVDVKLLPKPATLTLKISGPSDYSLTVNGRVVAVSAGRATLPAGEEMEVEIAAQGFKSNRRKLTLPANGAEMITLALERLIQPQEGLPWTLPNLGLVMQPIAAGTFTMGSTNGSSDEKPLTRVTFTRAFWLGRTEVTQGEWQAVMGKDPAHFKGADRPVEQVSWTDAMEFCRILTERERAADRLPEGYGYTLPTEAQWEYACRAGAKGDKVENLDDAGWYGQNSGKQTHPVGKKRANAWGLYDMHGNVLEWCADWSGGDYPGGSVLDYTGPARGSYRVVRGGSWGNVAADCSSTYRNGQIPDNRSAPLGFRLALVMQVGP